MQKLKGLVQKNRSYRQFDESRIITRDEILSLIDLARLSPSAGNLQPLRYYFVHETEKNNLVFSHLYWGGDTQNSLAPPLGQRPSAYIFILEDTRISRLSSHDQGIAAQTLLLGAVELDLGGCIIKSMDRLQLEMTLNLPQDLDLKLIIALGKPLKVISVQDRNPLNGEVNESLSDLPQQERKVTKLNLEDIIINP